VTARLCVCFGVGSHVGEHYPVVEPKDHDMRAGCVKTCTRASATFVFIGQPKAAECIIREKEGLTSRGARSGSRDNIMGFTSVQAGAGEHPVFR
jgi:hypothetical protein